MVARVYESDSKFAESEKYLKRAIAIRERTGASDDDQIAADLSQLAHLYVSKRDLAGAETLYQRVLKMREKATSSTNSPELLPALDALANLCLEQKRYSEAEALLLHTLSIREGSLGPAHVDVAKNLDRLGAFYAGQKQPAEAAKAYERSVFIWSKELGSENPELIDRYQKLAELYAQLDRAVDAEPLVQQVLSVRESDTVASLNTLASIYVAKENFAEAEPLYRLSLTMLDKRGILMGRRGTLSASDTNLDLLAETAMDYVDLLKKMKRKGDANKLEARIRSITGKNYVARKKAG
jgi:tetratricopeptide (TPR) repeat protein